MLKRVQVDFLLGKCLVRCYIIRKDLQLHIKALFFGFVLDKLHDFFRVTRRNAYNDLFLFFRRLFRLLFAAAPS